MRAVEDGGYVYFGKIHDQAHVVWWREAWQRLLEPSSTGYTMLKNEGLAQWHDGQALNRKMDCLELSSMCRGFV